MRQLILDTETTGLEVTKGHRIIEIAAVELIDRKLTGQHLHLYINPEREIDEGATKIHGITDAHVKDMPVFENVVTQIVEYIKDAELIIHNAKFDLSFLNHHFNVCNHGNVTTYVKDVIDTLVLARQKFPGAKNTLDALCDRYKISRANRNYHGALIDCHLLADVYLALTKEQISLLQDTETKTHKHAPLQFQPINSDGLNLKIIHPSQEELKLHVEYLKTLDKASHGNSAWFNQAKK